MKFKRGSRQLEEVGVDLIVPIVEFAHVDSFLLTRILSILVKRGVATVFKDDQGQESGIKFHGL